MMRLPRAAPSRAAALLALALGAGCARVWVTPRILTDAYRASPVEAAQVLAVRSLPADSIPGACARVAVLLGSGHPELTDEAEMTVALRREAGKAGANVVAILSWEEAGRGERVLDAVLGTGVDRDAVALALRCPAGAVEALARRGPE